MSDLYKSTRKMISEIATFQESNLANTSSANDTVKLFRISAYLPETSKSSGERPSSDGSTTLDMDLPTQGRIK